MPTPFPMLTSSLPTVDIPYDCLRRDDPAVSGNIDETLYETSGSREDAKLRESVLVIPWRSILCIANAGKTAIDAYNELTAHPTTYWPTVPWGQANFGGYTGSVYDFTSPVAGGAFAFVGSVCYWIGNFVGPTEPDGTPLGDPSSIVFKQVIVTQILCPQLWAPKNYEIWSVTGHWGTDNSYAGASPSPHEWSSSSDETMVSSGSLNPGQLFVIPPHDLDPVANCQSPPVPPSTTVPPNTNDSNHWSGWGVCNYIYFP